MKLKALENFTCYPGDVDANRMDIRAGTEFEIEDAKYARTLIEKGHAVEAGKPAEKKPGE